jgi:uncharacterized protein
MKRARILALVVTFLLAGMRLFADDKGIPAPQDPPRLVNDFAHMMSADQDQQLEATLEQYAQSSSCQITIVTVPTIGDYDISDYAIKLGKAWGVGKSGRNNGVVIIASLQDRKLFIATGKGLEGALTDYTCGKIRDKMTPFFKQQQYYQGFAEGTADVIAATKGEFKGDPADDKGGHFPLGALLVVIVIIIVMIIKVGGRGGGGGGGNYISGGGFGNLAAGFLLGNLLGGGGGRGRSDGGGGGGFGGFGGGDFGGGGAGGSW